MRTVTARHIACVLLCIGVFGSCRREEPPLKTETRESRHAANKPDEPNMPQASAEPDGQFAGDDSGDSQADQSSSSTVSGQPDGPPASDQPGLARGSGPATPGTDAISGISEQQGADSDAGAQHASVPGSGRRGPMPPDGAWHESSVGGPAPPVEGVIPSLPKAEELPVLEDATVMRDDAEQRRVLKLLVGSWRQVGGDRGPDFAVGGYLTGELCFRANGTLQIKRTFDAQGAVAFVRRIDYTLVDIRVMIIGKRHAGASSSLLKNTLILPSNDATRNVTLLPANRAMPVRLELNFQNNDRIDLGGRVYERFDAGQR